MELNDYQQRAMSTCTDSCNNFSYMLVNLVGEVGEFASKIGKSIRKEELIVESNRLLVTKKAIEPGASYDIELIKGELGDILWQLSGLCKVLGFSLEDVAQSNLDKLASRKMRNVIVGDGDKR